MNGFLSEWLALYFLNPCLFHVIETKAAQRKQTPCIPVSPQYYQQTIQNISVLVSLRSIDIQIYILCATWWNALENDTLVKQYGSWPNYVAHVAHKQHFVIHIFSWNVMETYGWPMFSASYFIDVHLVWKTCIFMLWCCLLSFNWSFILTLWGHCLMNCD